LQQFKGRIGMGKLYFASHFRNLEGWEPSRRSVSTEFERPTIVDRHPKVLAARAEGLPAKRIRAVRNVVFREHCQRVTKVLKKRTKYTQSVRFSV
jgi:hypothetical protein